MIRNLNRALLGLGAVVLTAGAVTNPGINRSKDLECLALAVYWEARSETQESQEAVAHVVLNRAASDDFPGTLCGVVHQGGERRNKCQFSFWCDGRSDTPTDQEAWEKAQRVAFEAYYGLSRDPTGGALYYHTHDVSPDWSKTFAMVATVGGHVFYKPED